jgi:diguanylate cyclase (GGDEF)-like protein
VRGAQSTLPIRAIWPPIPLDEAKAFVLNHFVVNDRPSPLRTADIDRFKSINDTFGHPAGDATLKAFAKLLKEATRRIDVCGRIGGKEFAVLLPNCDITGAYAFADRLRTVVRRTRIEALPESGV